MAPRRTHAPSPETFERLAREAVERLPEPFRVHLRDIVFKVEEFADEEVVKEMGLESPWELTGLYQGRPLDQQSVWSSGELPTMIFLYRQPLIAEWAQTGVSLEALITHVIVHEVGHHFGFSDEEMHAIEDGAG
ncbi:MAG: metallopeptidase family protein [Sphingomonadaceae bacterium]